MNSCSDRGMADRYQGRPSKPYLKELPKGWDYQRRNWGPTAFALGAHPPFGLNTRIQPLSRDGGRWSSDSFQTYIWEARDTAKGVAKKMINADLTPN
jgi:hypothetical protein